MADLASEEEDEDEETGHQASGNLGSTRPGKHTKNDGKSPCLTGKPWENHGNMVIYMERSTIFNREINYTWPFSIAM